MSDHFRCNICGHHNTGDFSGFSRESGFCRFCKSTVRMRSAIYGLASGLFGKPLTIGEFPRAPRYSGVGLSDWRGYAWRLRKALDYRNTFIHRRPFLDITDVPQLNFGQYDFVLSVDVFEHVPPPVERAFEGVSNLLRPGGLFVFSAPYGFQQETVEHFPHLHEFTVQKVLGEFCLINKTKGGLLEIFNNLHFHGGPGKTLEMRFFSYAHMQRLLADAGFELVATVTQVPQYGVIYDNDCSHTIIAYKAVA